MSERARRWLRLGGGAAILAFLLVQVGGDPFLDGLRATTPTTIGVALVITAGTTACCAWRWSLLSERLGIELPFRTAFRNYYRSQLINATLPGGVVGDVHRGIDHGRKAGAPARGLGSVVWDRVSGQAVQATMALAALPWLPVGLGDDARWALPVAAVAAAALLVWLGGRVVLASTLAAAGHAVVLVVAARSVGVDLDLAALVALALMVLLASAVPLSLAGWGPREGAAAWLFAEAGLGAATGVSVAVVVGVVSLLATLPGLVTLVGPWTRTAVGEEVGVSA
ncbi:flippase-like domain-containing protein [Nocardioides humilatus]|uniref:Flippase-like domain-containing protein n=1 Tax=Nocardioides humilatus TaxID=2607660 RepID=A0A5B1LHZ2_9ACTN|nr:lysylphosphatidylglycerol synthase transmembrane domain-containing protein [Nocardioides humilatus]KAA1420273.1 flippase-like domain-containing protein [Nocardioides humilatus]